MSEFVHSGVIAEQTGWMSEILEDPARTGVLVVTLAEDLPVAETTELIHTISNETAVAVASVVVNRVPEAGLDQITVEALRTAEAGGAPGAERVVAAAVRADRAGRVLGDLLAEAGAGVAGAVLPEVDVDGEVDIVAALSDRIGDLVAHLTSEHRTDG